MRGFLLLSVCALALASCRGGEADRALYAAQRASGEASRAGDFARAAAIIDSTLGAGPSTDRAGGGLDCGREGVAWRGARAAYADSVRATMCARAGYVRWNLADTSGALLAYRRALPYAHLLRDDSARVEALRGAAYVAAAAGDTALAVLVLDDAERVARAHGLNRLAAHILRCKAGLIGPAQMALPCDVPSEPGGPDAGLVFLVLAALCAALGFGLGRKRAEHHDDAGGAVEPSGGAP